MNLPFETIKRKLLTKRDSELREYKEKSIEELLTYGVICLNKPEGPTSHQVSDYVKQILNVKKAGHGGTLDPHVTGVLPIALDKGTRIVQTLLPAGKEYICLMYIHGPLPESLIRKTLQSFEGKITQLPPVRSAVKRQERKREIYYIEIIEIKNQFVLFKVGCQAGTYIRRLCLHPDTNIITKKGIMSISEFYKKPENIYSIEKNKIINKSPSKTLKIKSPKKLIKIFMSSGIQIIATADHKLLKSSENGYIMTEIENLKEGEYLVKTENLPKFNNKYIIADLLDKNYLIDEPEIKEICKKEFIKKYGSIREMNRILKFDRKNFLNNSKNAISLKHLKKAEIFEKVKKNIKRFKTEKGKIIELTELTPDFFYLLGLIASDGNNTKEKKTIRFTRIQFSNSEHTLIENFIEKYKKIFPNIPIKKTKKTKTVWNITTSNSLFATIAANLGIKSPNKKSDLLPIVNSNSTSTKSFLKGYFDGDGTVYFKKRSNNNEYRVDFFTINKTNAFRIHQMLLQLNIQNKIFNQQKEYFVVRIRDSESIRQFIKEIGTNHPKKKKKLEKLSENLNSHDHRYIGFHFKKEIQKNRSKLYKMGGNLSRILQEEVPITKSFYKKCSRLTKLPHLDKFTIEKIKKIEVINGTDYVYDMTIPKTHNFLIETGFISSNCDDFGKITKAGAHMAQLVRTKAGPFNDNEWYSLHDLKDAMEDNREKLRQIIKPIEYAVQHLPKIYIMDNAIKTLTHGADLHVPGVAKLESNIKPEDLVAIMSLDQELVCIGNAKMASEDILKSEKGLAVKTSKVFMEIKE